MLSAKILFYVVFGLALSATAWSSCQQCSLDSYASCLNETAFAVCYDGIVMSRTILECPKGQVCTSQRGVCKSRLVVKPECGVCDLCFSGFSCKTQREFEYCDDAGLTGIVEKCPGGQFCSLQNYVLQGEICFLTTMSRPTCYAADTVEPAGEPAADDYEKSCADANGRGFYRNIFDPTCGSYVFCVELNGEMKAFAYPCLTGSYFSPTTRSCVPTKPEGCM